ncbi:Chalcone isomerase-like protein 2 [Linum perenne]
MSSSTAGSAVIIDDEITLPSSITSSAKSLPLIAHGITDIEIHFLQIKFTAIGLYLDPNDVVPHLQAWKGKSGKDLESDDEFFHAVASSAAEKVIRVVVIKEIKGSQYGVQLESAVRDRLAEDDKYEEEEESELEKVTEFFQSKYLKKGSVLAFRFPAAEGGKLEIGVVVEGKEEAKLAVGNANVVETIKKWYLGGTRGVSPTLISSLAGALAERLAK